MNVKKTAIIYTKIKVNSYIDVGTQKIYCDENQPTSLSYIIIGITASGKMISHSSFELTDSLKNVIELHNKIEKIFSSDKEALLYLKSDVELLSKLSNIKIQDFPHIEVPTIMYHSENKWMGMGTNFSSDEDDFFKHLQADKDLPF